MKNLVFTVLAMLLLFACEKNDDFFNSSNQKVAPPFEVKNGTMHFDSDSAFYATCKLVSKMSAKEYKNWSNNTGLKSFRNELDVVLSDIEMCEDSLSLDCILSNNEDILEVKDSIITPIINSNIYASITNREGLFYINDVIYKVQGGKLAISLDGKIETVNNVFRSNKLKSTNSNVFVFEYSKDEDIQLKSTTYGHTTIQADKYGNYRRCLIQMISYNLYTVEEERIGSDDFYYTTYHFIDEGVLEVKVKNYKKSWGKYRPYNTICEMRNIEYTIYTAIKPPFQNLYYGNITGTMANKSSGSSEVKELTQVKFLGNRIQSNSNGSSNLNAPVFIRARAQGTNRGIGALWAKIIVGN